MFFKFRPKYTDWEVVDRKGVDPVPMLHEEEDLDLDTVNDTDICGTYVFDATLNDPNKPDVGKAVIIAKQQLCLEVAKKGFNVLVLESWNLTVLRRGRNHRIEVRYCGRPARASGKLPEIGPPPYMDVLKDCALS